MSVTYEIVEDVAFFLNHHVNGFVKIIMHNFITSSSNCEELPLWIYLQLKVKKYRYKDFPIYVMRRKNNINAKKAILFLAGGGGMASGTAFLAIAGPVGWTISGATLLASIALFANKKIKLNKEKKEEIEAVLRNVESVSEVNVKMQSLLDKTDKLRNMLNGQYGKSMSYYGKNFMEIADDGQMLLGTLVNNAKSLAVTLGETVEEKSK